MVPHPAMLYQDGTHSIFYCFLNWASQTLFFSFSPSPASGNAEVLIYCARFLNVRYSLQEDSVEYFRLKLRNSFILFRDSRKGAALRDIPWNGRKLADGEEKRLGHSGEERRRNLTL